MNTATFVQDISGSYDAFGRLRVSEPYSLFDCKLLYDSQPALWDDKGISGNGTTSVHNSNLAAVTMSVSSNIAGRRVRQTYQRFSYQPGKSQLIMLTGVIGEHTDGIIKRIGCFSSNNGLFFQSGPDDYYLVKRSSVTGTPVDLKIPQAQWNKNKLDSVDLITFDVNKANIFYFNYEWLGVGDICCGVVIGKKFVQLHQFYHANENTVVSFSKPNLPLRYEIENTGTGPSSSLVCICTTALSEGGQQGIGYVYTIDRGTTALSISTSSVLYPAITIRLRSGRDATNVFVEGVNIVSDTPNVVFRWGIYLNPTFSASIIYTPNTTNNVEYNNSTTNSVSISGGTLLYSGYSIGKESSSLTNLIAARFSLGFAIDGTSDVLCLAVQRLDNQIDSFYAGLVLRESV